MTTPVNAVRVVVVAIAWVIVSEGTVLAAVGATDTTPADQSSDDSRPPQRDLGDVIASILGRDDAGEAVDPGATDEDASSARFIVFPTVGGNPSIGFAVGALATLTNYWGDPATTPLSSMLVSGALTTKKQVLIVARSDVYAPSDTWHLTGDWRYYDFTERTYGLGSDRPDSTFADVAYDWYRFHQIVYRPLWAGLEVGAGYHVDARRNIALGEDERELLTQAGATPVESTTSSGVSLNVVYDTRDHPLNPESGVYGRASYLFNQTGLGSDSDWESVQLEGRVYRRLRGARRQVLAGWAIGWLTRAGQPSYFDLPSVGWDTYGRTARGYAAGRFRGSDWVYAELEYRTDLTRSGLLGAVAFINTSRFGDFQTPDSQRWVPGAGGGMRIKLDKDRRSNIAIDLAFGREGSTGLYLAINEAF